MIDSSSFMLLETNAKSQQSDVSRVPEKSGTRSDQGFSDYMNQSSEKSSVKPADKADAHGGNSQKSEDNVEKAHSTTVAEQKSSETKEDKTPVNASINVDESEEDTTEQIVETDKIVAKVEDDPEVSTAALVNLMLQRAIKSNIEDTPNKLKDVENAELTNQKQNSALNALIQKTANSNVTDTINKDILANQDFKQNAEKLSPELSKLLLAEEKANGNNKLQNLNNKQELLTQMQLKPVDEVMDIKQENSDLIAKFIEKLDLNKNKGEALFQNRMTGDRNAVMADVSEINLNRMVSESSDKSVLMNSLNNSERVNSSPVAQQLKMNIPVSNPEWGTEFGKRIQMLMKNNIQHAEIRMDPPELGRIQVRINMNQDQANISFTALHANVKEAIESNMTRLRDMLDESGLQLGEADVNSEFQQQTNQRSEEQAGFEVQKQVGNKVDENDVTEIPAAAVQHTIDGVIDYFA